MKHRGMTLIEIGVALCIAGLMLAIPTAARQSTVEVQPLMTTPVWLYSGAQQVSQGTGFFYGNLRPDGSAEAVFLVTNFHVVTGHAPKGFWPITKQNRSR